jgi:hypothetical protein
VRGIYRRAAIAAFVSTAFLAVLASGTAASAAAPLPRGTFGNFVKPSGVAVDEALGNVLVSDSGTGVVTISNSDGDPPNGVASPFAIEGFNFCASQEPSGIAVDNSSTSLSQGAVYVADVCNNAVQKFKLNPVSEEYESAGTLTASPGFAEPLGVSVDANGNLFVADYGSSSVIEFDDAGVEINRIDTSSQFHPSSVAVDSFGDVFVQGYDPNSVFKWEANLSGEVEPATTGTQIVSGGASGVAIDRATNALYVAMADHVEQYDAITGAKELEFGLGSLGATERLAVDSGSANVFVADKGNGKIAKFGPPPPPALPVIESQSVSLVGGTEATLKATVNPERSPTAYRFEYGPDTNYGSVVPLVDGSIGEGEAGVSVRQLISGLAPSTTYHFRIVAHNGLGPIEGQDQIFTTRPASGPGVPDNRGFEMVSPPAKHGVDILHNFGVQAATDGGAAIFSSLGGFADSPSASLANYYRAERGGDSWVTRGISPSVAPRGNRLVATSARAFNANLSRMVIAAFPNPPSVPGTQPTAFDFYKRAIPDGNFENLTPIVPEPDVFGEGQTKFAGADDALDMIALNTPQQLTSDAPPGSEQKAFVSIAGELHFVGILPDNSAAGTSSVGYRICCDEDANAVSSDGSQVVFSAQQPGGRFGVFARSNPGRPQSPLDGEGHCTNPDDACTVEASESRRTPPDPAGPRDAEFQGASGSGDRVLFKTTEELLNSDDNLSGSPSDRTTGSDMYLYEPQSAGLRRLSIDDNLSDGNDPEVQEVLGASDDARYVYFAARGLLVPGQAAVPGMHLYLWHDDGTPSGELSYLTTLNIGLDSQVWSEQAAGRREAVQVSPTGRYVVFTASSRLTAYENAGHRELYRFDAQGGQILCLSCDPSGEAATGDSGLFGIDALDVRGIGDPSSGAGFRSRNVLDDGKVFFESEDSLVPEDGNGKIDVYEWAKGSPALISSGTSGSDSHFANANPSGSDVFFLTREKLVGIDVDSNVDLYDARVNGGLASQNPTATTPCRADGCRGTTEQAPPEISAASASFAGRGNANQRRHSKHGKCGPGHRNGGRHCGRRSHKGKHHKRNRNTNKTGRASR